MAEIAIFIKTLLREKALFNCVDSITKHIGEHSYRFYIADDGPVSDEKRKSYQTLIRSGHVVLDLPCDTGASKSRNLLLGQLQDEKYVLRMDDDFAFSEETDLWRMKDVLEFDSTVGAVAGLERQRGAGKGVLDGAISPWQGFFERQGATLIKKLAPPDRFQFTQTSHGTRYVCCDFTRNMLLIRRKVFEDIQWEDRLKFQSEHEDFLLQLKARGWKIAFTPDSVHLHCEDVIPPSIKDSDYEKTYGQSNRAKQKESMDVLYEKWGINRIIQIPKPPLIYRLFMRVRRYLQKLVA